MVLGGGFKHMEKRFRVKYDTKTGVFRLLDTWHDAMQKISDWEAEIADDNPAMTIINDEGFTALAMEAARLGILGKAVIPTDNTVEIEGYQATIQKLETEKKELQDKLNAEIQKTGLLSSESMKIKQSPPRSERFELKARVVDKLFQLAVTEDIKDIDLKS